MVRPSQIARKARREHERLQALLQKQNLPLCPGCESCTETKDRANPYLAHWWHKPERKQSERSRIHQALKTTLFEGVIIIQPRETALAQAKLAGLNPNDHLKAVYWADGSLRNDGSCGIGVVYPTAKSLWTKLSFRVRGSADANVIEVFAISKAIEIAYEEARDLEVKERPRKICIYSDSVNALKCFQGFRRSIDGIKELPDGERLVGPSILAMHELGALGTVVELRYVPGHSGNNGNTKADRAAKIGARHAGKRRLAGMMIDLINT